MMKTLIVGVALFSGLAGFGDPMNSAPPGKVAATKPACVTAPTGSHINDHSCSVGNSVNMSADAVATGLRQNPGGLVNSH